MASRRPVGAVLQDAALEKILELTLHPVRLWKKGKKGTGKKGKRGQIYFRVVKIDLSPFS
jgi:hypothetical protein